MQNNKRKEKIKRIGAIVKKRRKTSNKERRKEK